jgi:SAM-dependent methyltransferase
MTAAWQAVVRLVAVETPAAAGDADSLNFSFWEQRAAAHASSPSYQFDRLIADPAALSEVVAFDFPRLGRLDGLDVVHLQCHIGSDTISLSRLGARSITGLDWSPASLAQAESLSAACGIEATWVRSKVYDAPTTLGAKYDLVYTGIGALNWLPSVRRWAEVVAAVLRPGGRLFIREGHPALYTVGDDDDGSLASIYPYFEDDGITFPGDDGSYVSTEVRFTANKTHEWNHGLAETIQAV